MNRSYCDVCDKETDNLYQYAFHGIELELCGDCASELENLVAKKAVKTSYVKQHTNIGEYDFQEEERGDE